MATHDLGQGWFADLSGHGPLEILVIRNERLGRFIDLEADEIAKLREIMKAEDE